MEYGLVELTEFDEIMKTYDIYKECMRDPSEKVFKSRVEKYLAEDDVKIYAFTNGEETLGVIVASIANSRMEIYGIAVAESARRHGIARWMIGTLIENNGITYVTAEITKESTDFFRKIGFEVRELEMSFNGEVNYAYECRLLLW